MTEKYWIIVNVSKVYDSCYFPWGKRLPADHRPRVIQADREVAEREVLRLAERHPDQDFVLFESVAYALESPVRRGVYHLEPITAYTL